MEKFEQKQDNTTKIGGMTMFKNMKKQLKNEKGLTLIELLAVIVILAIIAAIAIPAIWNIINNSRYNAIKSDAINVINAAQLYYLDHPEFVGEEITVAALKDADEAVGADGVYLENPGSITADAKISATSPHELTATVIFNGHSISFTNASIEKINSDTKKGSQIKDSYTVGSNE